MKKLLSNILIFSILTATLIGQESGTPSTLRVRVDANGYLVVASAAQTSPVTSGTFSSRVLKTDSSGNLLVVNTGGASGPTSYAASTCTTPGISLTGDADTGIAFTATPSILNCISGTAVLTLTSTAVTSTVPMLLPDGTAAAPAYGFSNTTGGALGFYRVANGTLAFANGYHSTTLAAMTWTDVAQRFASTVALQWSGTTDANAAADVSLSRDAAGILAQKNGTNAQAFRVYGTTTGPRYTTISHDGSDGRITTASGGNLIIEANSGGVLRLGDNALQRWQINAGHFLAETDNTYDIGASGANRPRNIYGAGFLTAPAIYTENTGTIGSFGFGSWTFPADGVFKFSNNAGTGFTRLILGTNNASGFSFVKDGVGVIIADGAGTAGAFLAGVEQTAPAAPSANGYRIYAQDNGAGKTQLCALFNSGVAQCFATEP